jgi:hypothetical protein
MVDGIVWLTGWRLRYQRRTGKHPSHHLKPHVVVEGRRPSAGEALFEPSYENVTEETLRLS